MKRKLIIIGISLAVVILGAAIMSIFIGMKEKPADSTSYQSVKYLKTELAKYSDFTAEVTAYGRLRSRSKIEIFSEVQGILLPTKPEFRVGNTFNKGDVLLRIDDREAELNLFSQKSDFLNALTQILPDIKSDFPDEFPKWDKYLSEYSITDNIKDMPEIRSQKLKYFLANKNAFKIFYSIKNQELRISKHIIRAPFNGTVTENMVEPGSLVRVGFKLGSFAGKGDYELELNVPSSEVQFINVGNPAAVSYNGESEMIDGRVVRIGNYIDQKSQTVPVVLSLGRNDLKDGLYMKAVIKGAGLKDVISIPRKAIHNNSFIYSIKDSSLVKINVDIVKTGEIYAFIKGPDEGEVLVVQPLTEMPTGTKVISLKNEQ